MVKKKKESKVLRHKQKSRAKYPYLDELKKLVDLANLVSNDRQLLNFRYELQVRRRNLKEPTGFDSNTNIYREILRECFEIAPEDFQTYIKSVCHASHLFSINLDNASDLEVHRMEQFYTNYNDFWQSMIHYINRVTSERKGEFIDWNLFPVSVPAIVLKDENGNHYTEGLAGLIGKFEPDRLRMCEICEKVFWAKREESETCSARCFGILRTRRYRKLTDEEKAERKAQREANKLRNKKLKEIKEKKNGNL